MGGSRSATSEEGASLLWEAQACRGGLFDHYRHGHLQRGHFAPSVPRKGTYPEWTPTSACLCLPPCGGTRRINQADKNAVTSRGKNFSSYDARTTQKSFKHSRQKLFIRGQQKPPHLQTKKGTQEIQNRRKTRKKNVPKRHEIRSCSICLISNTFTDKRILNLVVHLTLRGELDLKLKALLLRHKKIANTFLFQSFVLSTQSHQNSLQCLSSSRKRNQEPVDISPQAFQIPSCFDVFTFPCFDVLAFFTVCSSNSTVTLLFYQSPIVQQTNLRRLNVLVLVLHWL